MDTPDFKVFSRAVHERYEMLAKNELFVVDVTNIFETYLSAFPQGSNPVYRTNRVYDCNCCKQFIRKLGALVRITLDGEVQSVWDNLDLPHPFDIVAQRMSEIVRQAPIKSVFRTKERQYGTEYNYDTKDNNRWDHFHGVVGAKHFATDPEAKRGEQDTNAQVLRRGLEEIRAEDIQSLLELIDANQLYRGEQSSGVLHGFADLLRKYKAFKGGKDVFVWANITHHAARIRNTAIGTLLLDLASGTDLENAVRKYEAMVAPHNYKRPKALITQRMVDDAVKTLDELGLEGAVHRRFARTNDVSVRNVLFVDNAVRGKMKGGVAGLLANDVRTSLSKPKQATAVHIDTFVESILPTATTLDLLLEGRHLGNFVSLTGGDGDERLFKWDNNFAWSYDGEVTDSIKQRVKAAGGKVDALFRVSLSWSNYDDLDIHCVTPRKKHIYYSNPCGILDVDMNRGGGNAHMHSPGYSRTPVENLAFRTVEDGAYEIVVNNYAQVEFTDVGFTIEIEYGGQITQLSYAKAVRNKESVLAAKITFVHDEMQIEPGEGMTGGGISTEKWGVKTDTLVPVSIALNSPNYWDDNATGQKHWFFMLQGCKNPDAVRGIYNEFLRSDLEKHRKVFEVLGSKTKCPPTDDQISGVGFSAARNDTVTVVVNGRRAYNINF